MTSLSFLAGFRFLKHHPWQISLTLFGVVLGVAVVIAIDLAKTSALVSFDRATAAVLGKATHRITATDGLDENLYRKLCLGGIRKIKPVVEGYIQAQGDSLKLIGIDALAEAGFDSLWTQTSGQQGFQLWRRIITEPGAVAMGKSLAEKLNLKLGDTFKIKAGEKDQKLHLVGILNPSNALQRQALKSSVITDIATAQEIFDKIGLLTAIDVIVDENQPEAEILKLLPKNADWMTREAGKTSARQMTRAFYINLTALSLLSLLVGMFLIYNSVSFLAVQRRKLFGIFRVLGLTHQQILLGVLLEAAMLGMLGSFLGVLSGIGLGRVLLDLLAKTLNDVYFPMPGAELSLQPFSLMKGFVLGLGATLLAAAKPALESSRVNPVTVMARSVLEHQARRRAQAAFVAGIVMVGTGLMMLAATSKLTAGFVALTLVVLGCALFIPLLTLLLMQGLQNLGGKLFGILGRMPPRSVSVSLSRTGVATAALMVAMATTIGMSLMIHSFRHSVALWLERRLDADFYLYTSGRDVTRRPQLPLEFAREILKVPGVAGIGSVRYLRQPTDHGFLRINAYQITPQSFAIFQFKKKAVADVWAAFQNGWVIVSEAYASLHGVEAGDTIQLPTANGMQPFKVAAVFIDYNAGRGIVAMDRKIYNQYWHDDQVSTYWIYLKDGADSDAVTDNLRNLKPAGYLQISDNRSLLRLSLRIFDQAFAVTTLLRWLTTGVAFVGVFSALLALQLERVREMGILRALGLTPRQLWGQILAETACLGILAGVLAIPVGITMGWLLIEVINHRAFGWTLEMTIDGSILVGGVALAVTAAVLAGLYPAWKMSRTSPAEALRYE